MHQELLKKIWLKNSNFTNIFIKKIKKFTCNFYRYIVATQDKSLQHALYNVPAVPVMYFNNLNILLKAPSPVTIEHANEKKQSK